MKHIVALFTLGLLLFAKADTTFAQNSKQVQAYIERYRNLAMSEQQRVGMPAAIKLAQGIHETGAGTSVLARNANNHFGLKCKRGWTGETYMHSDDRQNECFRKYALDFESYQDQSNYLRENPRYAALFQLSVTDYAAWAMELRKAGYATNPRYAQELIKLIETYHLQQYTYLAMDNKTYNAQPVVAANTQQRNNAQSNNRGNRIWGNRNTNTAPVTTNPRYRQPEQTTEPVVTTEPSYGGYSSQTQSRYSYSNRGGQQPAATQPSYKAPTPAVSKVEKINNLRAVQGKKGQMPLQYAVANNVRYQKFLEMNDLEDAPLPADMPLYLERKHFWGIRPMHLVKPYETMLVIAQKEGIQLKYLRELNYLEPGEEPAPGVTLELQAQAAEKPRLASEYKQPVVVKKEMKRNPMQRTPDTGPFGLKIGGDEEAVQQTTTAQRPVATNPRYRQPETRTQPTSYQETSYANNSISDRIINDAQNDNATYGSNDDYEDDNSVATTQPQNTNTYNNPRYVDPNARKNTATTPPPVQKTAKELRQEEKAARKRAKLEAKLQATQPQPTQQVVQQPTQPVQQQPQTQLDRLTEQFDNVIYANNSNQPQQRQQVQRQPQRDPSKYYTVKAGDTAYTIAKKHGISVRQLMDWNGLDFDAIKPGQSLRIKP